MRHRPQFHFSIGYFLVTLMAFVLKIATRLLEVESMGEEAFRTLLEGCEPQTQVPAMPAPETAQGIQRSDLPAAGPAR